MKKISKFRLIWISIILILLFSIIPFVTASDQDSLLSIISVSLSAIGTAIALIALYVALTLYQKFGLESRFVERQGDKVLELADLLKNNFYTIKTNYGDYFMRFGVEDYEKLKKRPFYNYFKSKTLLIRPDEYSDAIKKILSIKRSYWLPSEIKDSLDFLELPAFLERDDDDDSKYAKLYFNIEQQSTDKWMIPYGNVTFDEFFQNKNRLSEDIEKWLKNHCDIELELNLNQANEFEKQ